MRLALLIVGAAVGVCLPLLSRAVTTSLLPDIVGQEQPVVFAALAMGVYGALAGWAVGALLGHLFGDWRFLPRVRASRRRRVIERGS